MSTGPVRRTSLQDIQRVQNLIERCLKLYMTEKEVEETLLAEAKIEPGFTKFVWQKLEEQNQEFFQAYYLRLMVKQQIIEFNKKLEQQAELMHQINPTGIYSISNSNGPHLPQMPPSSSGYAPENKGKTNLPNVFSNNGSSLYTGTQGRTQPPTHASRIDAPSAMLSTQSANMGLMQGINGKIKKPDAGYSGSSAHMLVIQIYRRGSAFSGTDNENFQDSGEGEHEGKENKRLDTISEGSSYDSYRKK